MFYQTIRNGDIPLSGDDASAFFDGKIWGDPVMRDVSFVATLRALLGDRIGDDAHLCFHAIKITEEQQIHLLQPTENELQLIWCHNSSPDEREAYMTALRQKIAGFTGYRYVEKVNQFLGRAFEAHAWSCPETNSAIMLTDSMDARRMHVMQSCIPVIVPWYFKAGEGESRFTEDELALIRSLSSRDDADYRSAMAVCARKFDMREFIIRRKLDGITKRMHETELENARNSISEYEARIHDLYEEISRYIRDRADVMTRVYGLQAQLADGRSGDELIDLFLSNPFLHLDTVSGTNIRFTASGPMENWDDDLAESIIDNLDSYVYRRASDHYGVDPERYRNLLRAIFLERKIKIMTYADYDLDLQGSMDVYHRDVHEGLEEYMPNPHLDHFDCLGDYRRQTLDCIMRGAFLQAFNYCLASARSLNWGDGTVIKEFVRDMCENYTESRCYLLPDGTNVAFDQAMEWANS